ncbi:efflux RND transporter periplasmic adaptor subunit [Propionivibrio soli]|uniref:efflux RND transporter periplasmic adaptor subunit n=1 Tax=Propionivibrio soli TaxID=2976531 RepID=UPI0021E98C7A|nr:efflux RND transporter periplasmic adaptor subunit [Propionivibrio soli]
MTMYRLPSPQAGFGFGSYLRPGARKAVGMRVWPLAGLIAVALVLSACSKPQAQQAGMGGGPAPVSAITVQPEALPITLDYTAQTLGSREVEVRARVTGLIVKRNYVEGSKVKAGQSLFTIDPVPYQTAVARAEADVAAAEARRAQAARDAARLAPLIEAKAVSRKDYDDAVSAEAIAGADLLAAKARLREARLNLDWTRVESPISGIASRALKSEGSLVSGPDVLLTTVTQSDPMQIIFGIPDNERLRLRQDVEANRLQWPKDGRFKVTLKLADGTTYSKTGYTDFTDLRVSRETGTSEARAEVANADGLLQPGQFVRVQLSGAVRSGVFRIPQRAVMEGPQGKFVYVVGKENKAEMRPVQTGDWRDGDIVVSQGLTPGEQVIVDGVLKLGPGAPVQVSAANAAPGAAQGAPAPANASKGG